MFVLSASLSAFAPSAPISFSETLPARDKCMCHWLLTLGKEVCGGILERLEGLINGEGLAEGFGTLSPNAVALETAERESNRSVSGC